MSWDWVPSWAAIAALVAAVSSRAWLGVAVAVLVLWMLGAHNRLMRLRAAIVVAWGQIEEQTRRRREALPPLVEALREPLAAEAPTLDAALEAQAQLQRTVELLRPLASKTLADLLHADSRLASALSRLRALLDQHPELRHREDIAGWLLTLQDIDTRQGVARHVFNDAVQAYNRALLQYPTRLLKPLFGLRTATTL
ncbi:LemA family protein [Azohydromonas caseinilytica]|uniref:LemA family protein n=1 Tax=Azohydromonas caseinilytica TaxID=2728836 RepID=A0A848F7X3_9BURK|nr:LemA family protein [Azohydromonas caseinilytica]NML16217.1 LemA family protein [Azohydromonas caseinilytica]